MATTFTNVFNIQCVYRFTCETCARSETVLLLFCMLIYYYPDHVIYLLRLSTIIFSYIRESKYL